MAPKNGLIKQNGIEPRIIANTRMSRIGGSRRVLGFGARLTQNRSCAKVADGRFSGTGGEEQLVQPESKHGDRPFVAHLGAPQLIAVISRLIDALDGGGR